MGHGHGGGRRARRAIDEEVAVGGLARNLLLAGLTAALVATIIGLRMWWPSGDAAEHAVGDGAAAQFAAPGVTFPEGTVVEVGDLCPDGGLADGSGCNTLRVEVADSADGGSGEQVGPRTVEVPVGREVVESGIAVGDRVQLMRTPTGEIGGSTDSQAASYSYFATDRDATLIWLTVGFVLVVLAIARWRGLFALIGLAFGGAVVWWFVLPALLEGASGIGVAMTGAAAIMFVVLYTTHGFSLRTSTALAGTLAGVALTAGVGVFAIVRTRLTGISDESGAILSGFAPGLHFQSLLGCAVVIAGLGVLNDVTITQASAVWELRAAAPEASRARIFAGAMRIGRDHIASTIYTIVFAYVGTALLVLMLLQVYGRPLVDLLSTEQLAEEIVRTLVSGIGLVLAVPITTVVASLVVSGPATSD